MAQSDLNLRNIELGNGLIGLTLDQVRELGITNFRIAKKDGDARMLTADVKIERMNFEIENDVIVRVGFG